MMIRTGCRNIWILKNLKSVWSLTNDWRFKTEKRTKWFVTMDNGRRLDICRSSMFDVSCNIFFPTCICSYLVAFCLLLSLFFVSIFMLEWFYEVNKMMRQRGEGERERERTNPNELASCHHHICVYHFQ